MSIHFDNVKIQSVRTEKSFYDEKQGKHIKYKNPKIIKKTLFQDDFVYDVGELYLQIKNCHERVGYDDEIVVSFKSTREF
tara:strand:+ start:196 stop:435 length:240 start_codon:yes stop_codon:yes gene_type:complete